MSAEDFSKTLASVATQLMTGNEVLVNGESAPIRRVGSGRLRIVQFSYDGRAFEAIEQNPDKPSQWGTLARKGRKVVQFKDMDSRKYVAVSVDGAVKRYSK